MLKLIQAELYKVWGKPSFLAAMGILLCINLFALWYVQRPGPEQAAPGAYRRIAADLRPLSPDQRLERIQGECEKAEAFALIERVKLIEASGGERAKEMAESAKAEFPGLYEAYIGRYAQGYAPRYAHTPAQEQALLRELAGEARQVKAYPAFLDEVTARAGTLSGVSIFSGERGSFSRRNIEKTAKDYAALRGTSVVFDVSKGMTGATSFFVTDAVLLLMLFLVMGGIFFDERGKGLFCLLRSAPRGRGAAMAAKLACLALSVGVMTLLLFGGNLLYQHFAVGLGELGRPVQSIGAFRACALPLTVRQYLLLLFGAKWGAFLCAGLLILCVSLATRRPAVAYLIAAAAYGAQFALYALIPDTSALQSVKYCNAAALIDVNGFAGGYLNLHLFGSPVGRWTASLALESALILLTAGLAFFVFCKKRDFWGGGRPLFRGRGGCVHQPSRRLMGQEAYKLLIAGRGLFILALFVAVNMVLWRGYSYYFTPDEVRYQNYMQILQGELTPEKEAFLTQEQEKLDEAQASLGCLEEKLAGGEITPAQAVALSAPYEKTLSARAALEKAGARAEYVRAHPGARFVYDAGYQSLFGSGGGDVRAGLLSVLCCALCLSAVFSQEYSDGKAALLASTPKGRRSTASKKLWLCAGVAGAVFLAAYLPGFFAAAREFGLPGLDASIVSLPEFSRLPGWMSIGGFTALVYLIRLAGCLCAAMITAVVSLRVKNTVLALSVSAMLLAAPGALAVMGLPFFYQASPLTVLECGAGFARSPGSCLLSILLWTAAGGLSALYCYRSFGSRRSR